MTSSPAPALPKAYPKRMTRVVVEVVYILLVAIAARLIETTSLPTIDNQIFVVVGLFIAAPLWYILRELVKGKRTTAQTSAPFDPDAVLKEKPKPVAGPKTPAGPDPLSPDVNLKWSNVPAPGPVQAPAPPATPVGLAAPPVKYVQVTWTRTQKLSGSLRAENVMVLSQEDSAVQVDDKKGN